MAVHRSSRAPVAQRPPTAQKAGNALAPAKAAAAPNVVQTNAARSSSPDSFSISPDWEKRLKNIGETLVAWIEHTEVKYDGWLLGANGKAYPPATPLSQVPGVLPEQGVKNDRTIIYANGAFTTRNATDDELQSVANSTGSKVIGLYNATEDPLKDAEQVAEDEFFAGDDKAADSLANVIYGELKAGREVDLFGHSQGGLISSRALTQVKSRLESEGMTQAEAERALSRVHCETFGAAAFMYPDGPSYTHWINDRDPAPTFLGLDHGHNPLAHAGAGAKIIHFSAPGSWFRSHSIQETYLPEREKYLAALSSGA